MRLESTPPRWRAGRILLLLLFGLLSGGFGSAAEADLMTNIGFTALQAELGPELPDGAGVRVSQIEARDSEYRYMPDSGAAEFSGKTLVDKTGLSAGITSHATSVGYRFYGNTQSVAAGITDIDVYEAGYWLWYDYLALGWSSGGKPVQPFYRRTPLIPSSPSRVANHSWVGGDPDNNSDILRRVDFVVETDEFIQVAAVNNGGTLRALLSGAYNAVTVGRTDGNHAVGTPAVDDLYGTGRVCPLIVVPLDKTSYAAPVVAAAAALLVQAGSTADLSTDPAETFTTDRSGGIIYNSACAEVIKASLLAGAERVTRNILHADMVDYRSAPLLTSSANGLDTRFGAGQLNIYNSYHIVAAGEQNSIEDDPPGGGRIGGFGFDRDPAFGGAGGTNRSAGYYFTAGGAHRRLYAALVWHLDVDGGTTYNWNGSALRYDLDLALTDVTVPEAPRRVAVSESRVDANENLWAPLVPGRSYRIDVTAADGQPDFNFDYALAWRMTTPPDTDADGIPDDWEVQFGLDPRDPDDAALDPDADGLDNLGEFLAGTDPGLPDTDGDGVPDGAEIDAGSDPLDPGSIPPPAEAVPAASGIWQLAAASILLWWVAKRFSI